MPYLKLSRDEQETPAPQPLPFDSSAKTWKTAGQGNENRHENAQGDSQMDSIARVEQALDRVESTFESLSDQVDELCEPILISDWLIADDDDPCAA